MTSPLSSRSGKVVAKRRLSGEAPKAPQSGISLKIKESSNELQNFLLQWNKLHVSGAAILSSIKTLKLDSIRTGEPDQMYPLGLQERCHELQKVLDKMESCVTNFTMLVQQLDALVELDSLQGGSSLSVGLSWTSERFRNSYQDILKAYSKELSLKIAIKEEIAHCLRKESLISCITSWTLQPFIHNSCRLQCESIFCETGVR